MKIHNVFHFNLLKKNSEDLVNDQILKILKLINILEEDEWLINNIFDFRYYNKNKQLQYKVKWHDFDRDNNWYNTNKDNFNTIVDVTNDFHQRYFYKSKFINRAEEISNLKFSSERSSIILISKEFSRRFHRRRQTMQS